MWEAGRPGLLVHFVRQNLEKAPSAQDIGAAGAATAPKGMAGTLKEQPLELDESELFDEEHGVEELISAGPAPLASQLSALQAAKAATAAAALPAGLPQDSDSESDDDGIVLESECSSSGGSKRQLGHAGRAGCLRQAKWSSARMEVWRYQPPARPRASNPG